MASIRSILSRRLTRPVWLCGLGLVGATFVLMCWGRLTAVDMAQLQTATVRLASGHISGLYPGAVVATSPPGYPLAAALPYALAHLWWAAVPAYQRSALLVCPALAATAVFAGRRLGLPRQSAAEVLLAGLVTCAPLVTDALVDEFHPEDLAAVAWLCLAVAALSRRHWIPAGLFLAAGLLTRQWTLLAVLPALAWAPRGTARWRLVVSTGLGALGLLLPFLVADFHGLLGALGAGPFHANAIDLWPLLPGVGRLAGPIARSGPVVLAALVSWGLARRWSRSAPPGAVSLVWAMAATLTGRMVFDTYFGYYLAPGLVLFALADVSSPERRGTAAVAMVAVYAVLSTVPAGSREATIVLAVAYMCGYLTVIAVALRAALDAPVRDGKVTTAPALGPEVSVEPSGADPQPVRAPSLAQARLRTARIVSTS